MKAGSVSELQAIMGIYHNYLPFDLSEPRTWLLSDLPTPEWYGHISMVRRSDGGSPLLSVVLGVVWCSPASPERLSEALRRGDAFPQCSMGALWHRSTAPQ